MRQGRRIPSAGPWAQLGSGGWLNFPDSWQRSPRFWGLLLWGLILWAPLVPVQAQTAEASVGIEPGLTTFLTQQGLLVKFGEAQRLLHDGQLLLALPLLQEILDEPETTYLPLPSGKWLPIRSAVEQAIENHGLAAVTEYRRQFGDQARFRLQQGLQQRNEEILVEVYRRFWLTSAGAQAADMLATIQLDRGAAAAALSYWERLNSSRTHRLNLAPASRCKQALAFAMLGDRDKAQSILAELPTNAPLLGTGQPARAALEPVLERVLPAEKPQTDWFTFQGNTHRNAFATGGLPLLTLPEGMQPISAQPALKQTLQTLLASNRERSRPSLVGFYPLAIGPNLYYRDFRGTFAIDLETGLPIWQRTTGRTGDTEVTRFSETPHRSGQYTNVECTYLCNSLYGSLAVDEQHVYCLEEVLLDSNHLTIRITIAGNEGKLENLHRNVLTALDRQTGEVRWQLGADSNSEASGGSNDFQDLAPFEAEPNREPFSVTNLPAEYFFLGPPLVHNHTLYILAENRWELQLLALDPETGAIRWSEVLALAERRIDADLFRRSQACWITYADGLLLCPTQLYHVFTVDPLTHTVVWQFTHPDDEPSTHQNSMGFTQIIAPPREFQANDPIIVADGRALISASAGKKLYCVQLTDGKELWRLNRENDHYLAGVYEKDVLLVGSEAMRAVSLLDGKEKWSVELPALPSGRGIRLQDQYLLPIDQQGVLAIDLRKGEVAAEVRHRLAESVGNLLVHANRVIGLGVDGLRIYPMLENVQRRAEKLLQGNPQDPRGLFLQAQLQVAHGQVLKALQSLTQALAISGVFREELQARQLLFDIAGSEAIEEPVHLAPMLPALKQSARSAAEWGIYYRLLAEQALASQEFDAAFSAIDSHASLSLTEPIRDRSSGVWRSPRTWERWMIRRLLDAAEAAVQPASKATTEPQPEEKPSATETNTSSSKPFRKRSIPDEEPILEPPTEIKMSFHQPEAPSQTYALVALWADETKAETETKAEAPAAQDTKADATKDSQAEPSEPKGVDPKSVTAPASEPAATAPATKDSAPDAPAPAPADAKADAAPTDEPARLAMSETANTEPDAKASIAEQLRQRMNRRIAIMAKAREVDGLRALTSLYAGTAPGEAAAAALAKLLLEDVLLQPLGAKAKTMQPTANQTTESSERMQNRLVEAEGLLLRLLESSDINRVAWAQWSLARLAEHRQWLTDAEYHYQILARQFPDLPLATPLLKPPANQDSSALPPAAHAPVPAEAGSPVDPEAAQLQAKFLQPLTGESLYLDFRERHPHAPRLNDAGWDFIDFDVVTKTRAQQKPTKTLELNSSSPPYFDNLELVQESEHNSLVGPNHRLLALDRQTGTQVWAVALPLEIEQLGNYRSVHSIGHLVLLNAGDRLLAISPLDGALLWSRAVEIGATPSMRIDQTVPEEVQPLLPNYNSSNRQDTKIHLLGPEFLVLTYEENLLVLDPQTGQDRWSLTGVEVQTVLGDREYLFVSDSRHSEEVRIFATLDGEPLRQGKYQPLYPKDGGDRQSQKVFHRYLSLTQSDNQLQVLRLWDPWQQEDRWRLTFPADVRLVESEGPEIAVFTPGGQLTIIHRETGQQLIQDQLPTAVLSQDKWDDLVLQLFGDRSRLFFSVGIKGNRPETFPSSRSPVQPLEINGQLFAYQRDNGKRSFQKKLLDRWVVAKPGEELPLLVVIGCRQNENNIPIGLLDKRTGKYQEENLPMRRLQFSLMRYNAVQHWIELWHYSQIIRLELISAQTAAKRAEGERRVNALYKAGSILLDSLFKPQPNSDN